MGYTRRTVVAAAAALLAGCGQGEGDPASDGGDTPTGDNPARGAATGTGSLSLTSPAFADGEAILERFGHSADNVNPPLRIEGVPEGAASLVLVVDDPDAVEPAGKVWVHWLVWNIEPSRTEIPEGWNPESATVGTNDFDNSRYDGPDPPDGTHTYRFKLYALDTTLSLGSDARRPDLGLAMEGHVLAETQLTGTYSA